MGINKIGLPSSVRIEAEGNPEDGSLGVQVGFMAEVTESMRVSLGCDTSIAFLVAVLNGAWLSPDGRLTSRRA